jgi:hypothetical protein
LVSKPPLTDAQRLAKEAEEREWAKRAAEQQAALLRGRMATLKKDALKAIHEVTCKHRITLEARRFLFKQRFDPKVKNAAEKFDNALKAAGMTAAERLEARGGATHIKATYRRKKAEMAKPAAPQGPASLAKPGKVGQAVGKAVRKIAGPNAEQRRLRRYTRRANDITARILNRGPWTVKNPATGKWEPPLALDKKLYRKTRAETGHGVVEKNPRSKAAYIQAARTGATYRRMTLPRARRKLVSIDPETKRKTWKVIVPSEVAWAVHEEVSARAIKRKFKNTFQGRESTYGGVAYRRYLANLPKGTLPSRTGKSFQATEMARRIVGGREKILLPSGAIATVTGVRPILKGKHAGRIMLEYIEDIVTGNARGTKPKPGYGGIIKHRLGIRARLGTEIKMRKGEILYDYISDQQPGYQSKRERPSRERLLPFLRKEPWTKRMRVVMPKTNAEWLEPGEMTPEQASAVLHRILEAVSPGKGHLANYGGQQVTERLGFTMLEEVGDKAVAGVQDAIRHRELGYVLSARTVAYRRKMMEGGQVYSSGTYKGRKTWHDFPARKIGDEFPIVRPSGKHIVAAASADHPLLWTGTLINSIESHVDYEGRYVLYGVFRSNSARHPVDGKMMYDIAGYLLKNYNFLAHHVVMDKIRRSTVKVMADYFNKLIHGAREIEMRGRVNVPAHLKGNEKARAAKKSRTPKVGGIDDKGIAREEDVAAMKNVVEKNISRGFPAAAAFKKEER